jgi:hypothetical protein
MVKSNLWYKKFNADDDFVWRRTGEPVSKEEFTPRRIRQFYDGRYIVESNTWSQFVGVSSPASDDSGRVVDSAPVSPPATSDPRDELRAQLDSLGVEYDNRWGEKKLTEALEEATKPITLPGVNDGAT